MFSFPLFYDFSWFYGLVIMVSVFLYGRDISIVNGVCDKTARQYIKDILEHFNLPPRNFVSLKAYCDYFMADEQHVLARLEEAHRKQ